MLNSSISTIDQNILIFSEIGLFSLIFSIVTWAILRREIICPYVIYLVAGYTFMYGQCLMWALFIDVQHKSLYSRYTPEEIFPGQVFTVIALLALHLGAILTAKDNTEQRTAVKSNELLDKPKLDLSYQAIKASGWILFAVSVLPFLYMTISDLRFVSNNTYHDMYYNANESRIDRLMAILEEFFIPSLFILLIAYKDNRAITAVIVLLCAVYIGSQFIIGLRSTAFMVFIGLICAWHFLIKPFKLHHIILICIAIYFLFSIGTILGYARNIEGRTLSDYIAAYTYASEKENTAISLFGELGWTLSNTIEVIKLVPSNYPFRYGSSYMYSLTTIIPNLGFWDIHPAAQYANLSAWLQQAMNLHYGPGFSPVAEAYINFGWFGPFFMVFEGGLIGRMLSLSDKYSVKTNPETMSIGLIFLLVALKSATRSSALVMVRSILYNVLPIYLLILLVKFTIKHISSKSTGNSKAHRNATTLKS